MENSTVIATIRGLIPFFHLVSLGIFSENLRRVRSTWYSAFAIIIMNFFYTGRLRQYMEPQASHHSEQKKLENIFMNFTHLEYVQDYAKKIDTFCLVSLVRV